MSEVPPPPPWRVLLAPRGLTWHLFAVAAVVGMPWLGKWQFDRAIAGNTLSWAYTFEWPIFAIFGIVFWIKTVKDELHPAADSQDAAAAQVSLPTAGQSDEAEAPQEAAPSGAADPELAEYNAYLAKLASQVKGHGRWHGLR